MIDNATLEVMSLADLKQLQITISKLIDSKTAALKKEILADAKQRAADNGIDPKTLFEEPKKRGRKKTVT